MCRAVAFIGFLCLLVGHRNLDHLYAEREMSLLSFLYLQILFYFINIFQPVTNAWFSRVMWNKLQNLSRGCYGVEDLSHTNQFFYSVFYNEKIIGVLHVLLTGLMIWCHLRDTVYKILIY